MRTGLALAILFLCSGCVPWSLVTGAHSGPVGSTSRGALTDHVRGSAVLVGSAMPGDQRGIDDGGIADLVRSAAATYAAQGFRVNAVAPGPLPSPEVLRFFGNRDQGGTLAEQFPLGRWSDVLDTAGAIRWLLSDEAAWVTGRQR